MISFKNHVKRYLIKVLKIDFSLLRSYYFREKYKSFIENDKNYLIVRHDDLKYTLRRNSSDEDVFYQVFMAKEYSFLVDLINKYNQRKPIGVVIDFGANIGLTSIYFNKLLNPAKIYLLEPDQSNFLIQMINITENHLKNFELVNKAVWTSSRKLVHENFRDGKSWSVKVVEGEAPNYYEAISIVDLIKLYQIEEIDIVKIDIEGTEKELLTERNQLEFLLSKTKYLAIELHDEIISRIEFTDFLYSIGFKIYSKGETLFGVNQNLVK